MGELQQNKRQSGNRLYHKLQPSSATMYYLCHHQRSTESTGCHYGQFHQEILQKVKELGVGVKQELSDMSTIRVNYRRSSVTRKIQQNDSYTKGQLISKGLFGLLEFFQKTNVGAILCTENCPNVRFLEESRRPKSPFEIN